MAYYNTNQEAGAELRDSRRNASNQEDEILAFFERRPGKLITPCDVEAQLGEAWPITSIRRAITNLTQRGKLEKTDTTRLGAWGKRTHCWRYITPVSAGQLELF